MYNDRKRRYRAGFFCLDFWVSNSVKYDTIDYEIMNILVTLSEPAKKNIKNILEMINKNYS